MIDIADLKAQAQGRWYNILISLGISEAYLTKKHCACPMCRNGVDRFRWIDKDGTGSWYCGQCDKQAGDGIALVKRTNNWTFPETIKRISELLGVVSMDKVSDKTNNKMSEAEIKVMLNRIFNSSVPLSGSDPASLYLHGRKLVLQPDNVRYCAELYESDSRAKMPAMVAKFMNKEGLPIGIHRVYLKDNKSIMKKMSPTLGLLAGGAIRLFSPKNKLFESDVLGIGEGIESSIAAAQIHGVAVWSAYSSACLESFDPPEDYRRIVIFGDNDASWVGQTSAHILAKKLYKQNRIVDVVVPPKVGQDWNDVLLEQVK